MNAAPSRTVGLGFWEVALIMLLALAFRLIQLDESRHPDDYYHLMAAASWLREGTLSIGGDEPYDRAYLFTYLVAVFQGLFGETTYVARLPAVMAGVAWVVVLFLWVRSVAGRSAAWVAALLFCFDSGSLALAHMVRFYTLHGLVFFLGAIGLYYLVVKRPNWGGTALIGVTVIAALSLAYHLQLTTVIGGVALIVWLAVELFPRALAYLINYRSKAVVFGAPVLALGLFSGLVLLQFDVLAAYWARFSSVPMWAEATGEDLAYYFRILNGRYPVLWALFPLAALIAIAKGGRPAIFAFVLFTVPFILHSLAAFKAERFLGYAMPFFFATWGIAIGLLFPKLKAIAKEALVSVIRVQPPERVLAVAASGVLIVVMASLILTNKTLWSSVYRVVVQTELPSHMRHPNWDKAVPLLRPYLDSVEVVLASGGGPPFYHLDRVHAVVHAEYLGGRPEFSFSDRLGLPVISSADSLELLIRCHKSGLVVIDRYRWGQYWGVSEEFIEALVMRADPVQLPEEWGVRAYTWRHDQRVTDRSDCPDLEARKTPWS